jgi:hypothetical protein
MAVVLIKQNKIIKPYVTIFYEAKDQLGGNGEDEKIKL